ncbi:MULTISPECIES: type II toxin-antitoxin system RelE/ParE family toxin [Acidobacteriaceae]|uniref:type II toxin-antitoxin system RelE/ParE family toxin n=1 Tax=Acidobacteriaceae TaxID=204434 RepID=UPI001C2075B8|nr:MULTISPECIES: type II toxin-antitoxin system RelE/ParE family toxin [Acidobacteriaceae]MDW5266380.1 type II toxin-antitoxin system RelE/ParE family toxin [Edaphobacter sp.]
MYEIRHYVTRGGKDIYAGWHDRLRDGKARVAVDRRLSRIESGNFGDHKFCMDGVWELRIDVGPGYRVYYGIDGGQIVLLLSGGDKGSQTLDIQNAAEYWRDWKERTNER